MAKWLNHFASCKQFLKVPNGNPGRTLFLIESVFVSNHFPSFTLCWCFSEGFVSIGYLIERTHTRTRTHTHRCAHIPVDLIKFTINLQFIYSYMKSAVNFFTYIYLLFIHDSNAFEKQWKLFNLTSLTKKWLQ